MTQAIVVNAHLLKIYLYLLVPLNFGLQRGPSILKHGWNLVTERRLVAENGTLLAHLSFVGSLLMPRLTDFLYDG